MAEQSEKSLNNFLDFSAKFLIPFILAFVTWQQTEMGKLEDRVYVLQRDAVTEQKLSEVEKRLIGYMDVRISDITMKQDMTNQYLKMVLETVKDRK